MIYSIAKTVVKFVLKILYKVEVKGLENLPKETGAIICSNHTNNFDPLIVACFVNRPIHYMAKKELFKNKFIKYFLRKVNAFPVNRERADISAIKYAIKVVKNNNVLGIFPEGTRVKAGETRKAEPGIAMIAIKGKVVVIPVGIIGEYKLRERIVLNIGQPIHLDEYYRKKLNIDEYKLISENIMTDIRRLMIET